MDYPINLISDTVTRPSKGMLQAMINAPLGDDVFKEDPTVIALEERLASMFGHEAGIFCPSGTMTNQIAIKLHTQPLDELLCDVQSHVYQYEVSGYAFHSGLAVNPIHGENGKLTAKLISENIKPRFDWLPITKLVVLENTANRAGGNYYQLDEIQSIQSICKQHQLNLHLDGARIFNALLESGIKPLTIGSLFDSISICLSKGLGAPVGSVLVGKKEFIHEARRIRKVFGGGMRQAGVLAGAALYALDHNIERLKEDHENAAIIANTLKQCTYIASMKEVKTNIIIFDLAEGMTTQHFLDYLHQHGIHASAFGKQSIRFVTHLDITKDMIEKVCQVLLKLSL